MKVCILIINTERKVKLNHESKDFKIYKQSWYLNGVKRKNEKETKPSIAIVIHGINAMLTPSKVDKIQNTLIASASLNIYP